MLWGISNRNIWGSTLTRQYNQKGSLEELNNLSHITMIQKLQNSCFVRLSETPVCEAIISHNFIIKNKYLLVKLNLTYQVTLCPDSTPNEDILSSCGLRFVSTIALSEQTGSWFWSPTASSTAETLLGWQTLRITTW